MFVAAQEAPRGLRGAGRAVGGLLHALAKGGLSPPAGESTFFETKLFAFTVIFMEYDGPNASVKCSANRRLSPKGAPATPAPPGTFLSV
ncbi:hypothetical protein E2C01_029127 [Portunus trituberculatus]|uniref:Uncharacterized protein n=1 Tax=Portunus trituberculatus TaxID=210409 RepID=A0A5B7EQZ5_PORTR|nr:hypothetical protein [Portunus trituberculatus]